MREPAYYIGKPVTSLQTMLRAIARQDGTIPPVIPDGSFGPQTMQAVLAFQKQHRLRPTGTADYETWSAVCEAFREAELENRPPEPVLVSLPKENELCEGCAQPQVLLLQVMLHTVSGAYSNLSDCALTGAYDADTASAVRALQTACDLDPTGTCNKKTWQYLSGLYTLILNSEL